MMTSPGIAAAHTVMPREPAPFHLLDGWIGQTGEAVRLCEIGGDEPLELGALFLRTRDTTRTRKGCWRLRREIGLPPSPWHLVLPGERRGEITLRDTG